MFLKNYYKILLSAMKYANGTGMNYNGGNVTISSTPAHALMIAAGNSTKCPDMRNMMNSFSKGGAIIGTGTVTPAPNDYCLSGAMITTFSASASVTVTSDELGECFTAVYTITNTGSEDFTIGEIGLVALPGSGSSSGASNAALIERTVLDEPLTIPAGGVGQVTYTIRMNFPTA